MKWLLLLASITCQVIGAGFLKLGSEPGPHANYYNWGMWLSYIASFYLFYYILRHFDLSTAYALWAGAGVVLVSIVAVLFFGDEMSMTKMISIGLIVLGIVGLGLNN